MDFHTVESTGFHSSSQPWYSGKVRVLNDYWAQRAKREGYPARSVYKLQELEERFHILRGAKKILDVGAAPGSWTLYLLRTLHPAPRVVAVDLTPLALSQQENLTYIQGDITDPVLRETLIPEAPFDVILSDAAPSTTGIRTVDTARSQALVEAVLGLVPPLLRVGGSCIVKVFQGSDTRQILQHLDRMFQKTRSFKPKACRTESFELYCLGLEKREGFN
ncbi:MAG: RlmE family RNA methyltransferase [Spirochaetes bacterium]|nr:RlmE family RNA methyltransferase [Spirochaetota bacterium]